MIRDELPESGRITCILDNKSNKSVDGFVITWVSTDWGRKKVKYRYQFLPVQITTHGRNCHTFDSWDIAAESLLGAIHLIGKDLVRDLTRMDIAALVDANLKASVTPLGDVCWESLNGNLPVDIRFMVSALNEKVFLQAGIKTAPLKDLYNIKHSTDSTKTTVPASITRNISTTYIYIDMSEMNAKYQRDSKLIQSARFSFVHHIKYQGRLLLSKIPEVSNDVPCDPESQ